MIPSIVSYPNNHILAGGWTTHWKKNIGQIGSSFQGFGVKITKSMKTTSQYCTKLSMSAGFSAATI